MIPNTTTRDTTDSPADKASLPHFGPKERLQTFYVRDIGCTSGGAGLPVISRLCPCAASYY